MAQLLAGVNELSDSAILPDQVVTDGQPIGGDFSGMTLRGALDSLVGYSRWEWDIGYEVHGGLRAHLVFGPTVGEDRRRDAVVALGGNATFESATIHRPLPIRIVISRDGEAAIVQAQGYAATSGTAALRGERFAPTPMLGKTALRNMDGIGDPMQEPSQVVQVRVQRDADVWRAAYPGNWVQLADDTVAAVDFNGPARVLAAQPLEERGELLLSLASYPEGPESSRWRWV